jgi:nucleolar GTP-binding protein
MRRIPTILTSDEIMDKAYHRAAKIKKNGATAFDGRKKTALAKVNAAGNIVTSTLDKYLEAFPKLEKEEAFYPELIDIIVGLDQLKRSLGAINWASKRAANLERGYSGRIRRAKDIVSVEVARKEFYGRLSSILRQISGDLDFVGKARDQLKRLPTIDPNTPTVVIAGFPNVGKSQLVTALSNATPEINSYPFTTKGIVIGHYTSGYVTYQIIDTPGLLDRRLEDRNDIERQAVLALKYLANVLVFMLDPTETSGYSMEQQLSLMESVKKGFEGIPIVVVENKVDLLRTDSERWKISAQTGEGVDELMAEIIELFKDVSFADEQ